MFDSIRKRFNTEGPAGSLEQKPSTGSLTGEKVFELGCEGCPNRTVTTIPSLGELALSASKEQSNVPVRTWVKLKLRTVVSTDSGSRAINQYIRINGWSVNQETCADDFCPYEEEISELTDSLRHSEPALEALLHPEELHTTFERFDSNQ